MNRFGAKSLIVLFFLLADSPLVILGADARVDTLWTKALAVFNANKEWTPARMEIQSEELTRRGETKNRERRIFKISVDKHNQMISEIIFAEKNGEDITEKERSEREREGQDNGLNFPSPFDPSVQDKVEVTPTDSLSYVNGHLCREFAVRMHWEKKRYYVGTGYLRADTGVPLRFVATVDPLPIFVQSIDIQIDYNDDPDNWYMDRVEFEGKGTIILITRWYKSALIFSDYFRSGVTGVR